MASQRYPARAGPSREPDEEVEEEERAVERAQQRFERSQEYDHFTLHTRVGYRNRSDKYQGGDVLLSAKVTTNDDDDVVTAAHVIVGIQEALEELVEDLKEE